MLITIASGKGGTGKTTLASNMAVALARDPSVARQVRLLDCDVEEPNCHLFLHAGSGGLRPITVPKPVWDAEACKACGRCKEACRYNAVALMAGNVLFFHQLCHACGACILSCSASALIDKPHGIGRVRWGNSDFDIAVIEGRLDVGSARSKPLIDGLCRHLPAADLTIVDAPPGSSASTAAALRGADHVFLISEPTLLGLHDLQLAAGMLRDLRLPFDVVLNRCDLGDNLARERLRQDGFSVLAEIPFMRSLPACPDDAAVIHRRYPELGAMLDRLLARLARSGAMSA